MQEFFESHADAFAPMSMAPRDPIFAGLAGWLE
jgi:hypothetical protein